LIPARVRKLAWFVGLWAASVIVVAAAAYLIRFAMGL